MFIIIQYLKKNLHLVNAAKTFTEKSLNIKNCPTETKIIFYNKKEKFSHISAKKSFLALDHQVLQLNGVTKTILY